MGRGSGGGAGTGVVGSTGAGIAAGLIVSVDNLKAVQAASLNNFGRKLSNSELATLAGAPDGARVDISANPGSKYITVAWSKGMAHAHRTLGPNHITNGSLYIDQASQGSGLALRSLSRQVAFARKVGVKALRTHAAGSPGSHVVGYKVWPKFGYDGRVPSSVRAKLPGKLKSARLVSDLYKTKAGREAWEKHGTEVDLKLSLRTGSKGLRRFEAYKDSKGVK